jgi:hypothetical protein
VNFLSGLGLFIFLLVYGVTVRGYTVMKLWEWFIVPLFNVAPFTLLSAYGVALFVQLFHTSVPKEVDKRPFSERMLEGLLHITALNGLFLVLGYIIYFIQL